MSTWYHFFINTGLTLPFSFHCPLFYFSGNLDTILVLISWDRQQTPPYDGVHLLTSLLDSQTDAIEPIRLLLSINKYNFFSKTENGDNILHIISSKTSREVSSEIIWTIWRQEDAKFAKFEKNREGKTPYQVSCLLIVPIYFQITIQKKDLFMFRFQWDLWMYSVFPRFLPVWITAFACLSPSLFFPIFGWFNGTIITLCVWIISDILGQRTISPQASRTAQGVAWGLLFLITYEYWTHIQLEISSTLFSMLYYLLALGSAVLMLWVSFAEAKRVDPLDR